MSDLSGNPLSFSPEENLANKELGKAKKIIAELEKALVVARGAMAYAYEDYADRFYLNVKEDITVALQKLKEFKG